MKQRNNFLVEEVEYKYSIFKIYKNEKTHVADIEYDEDTDDCFIRTISSNFQNYVVTYDDFKDFIYLVDYAYDELAERFK